MPRPPWPLALLLVLACDAPDLDLPGGLDGWDDADFEDIETLDDDGLDCERVDPFPSTLLDDAGLTARRGTLRFVARDGNALTAHTYRATGFDPGEGPILFVMHGTNRNASAYLDTFAPVAERHGALAIAMEFPRSLYPTAESYTYGVGTAGSPYGGTYDPDRWRDPHDYLYAEVEHLFEAVRERLGGSQCGYRLVGHSAGGQFIHRLLTFRSDARVERAVAANAGWYTLPAGWGSADPNVFAPYGLQGTPVQPWQVGEALQRRMDVLLGEWDTRTAAEDSNVRGTPEAQHQGPHRLARGRYYWEVARAQAEFLDVPFRWRKGIVPRAGHSKDAVAQSAAWYLFGPPDEPPCAPSEAPDVDVVFHEILAGASGDANGDGVVHAGQDAFVELVNRGGDSACLSGWTLQNSRGTAHVFALGTELGAGEAVVVFGGGIPTGAFGGALVQWSQLGGLGLAVAGERLSLRDRGEAVADEVSWGSCGGATCAADHISHALGTGGSVTRWPDPHGGWHPHQEVVGAPWSPGVVSGGGGS